MSKRIDIISIFPEMLQSYFSVGVLSQALEKNILEIHCHNPRSHTEDKHKIVDGRPFGGGEGMLMRAEPLKRCFDSLPKKEKFKFIYLSPQGETLSSKVARELASYDQLIFLSGRYEGVDERFLSSVDAYELSIGDYVLSGGELACLVSLDVISRFYPGVLGNEMSFENDSFEKGVLKCPQFTRPETFKGVSVPEILKSGNHKLIADFRRRVSLLKTRQKRPDLFQKLNICENELNALEDFELNLSENDKIALGLMKPKVD